MDHFMNGRNRALAEIEDLIENSGSSDWHEDKHPRGKGGKFAKGSDGGGGGSETLSGGGGESPKSEKPMSPRQRAEYNKSHDRLKSVKVGDPIVVQVNEHTRVAKVEKIAPDHVVIGGKKYDKDTGKQIGGKTYLDAVVATSKSAAKNWGDMHAKAEEIRKSNPEMAARVDAQSKKDWQAMTKDLRTRKKD